VKTAAELLDAHFREMRADFAAWCALYADDAVIEYPHGAYASVVSPLTGIAAMSKSVRGFFGCGSGLSRQRLEGLLRPR
jgi:hypothetical protein